MGYSFFNDYSDIEFRDIVLDYYGDMVNLSGFIESLLRVMVQENYFYFFDKLNFVIFLIFDCVFL